MAKGLRCTFFVPKSLEVASHFKIPRDALPMQFSNRYEYNLSLLLLLICTQTCKGFAAFLSCIQWSSEFLEAVAKHTIVHPTRSVGCNMPDLEWGAEICPDFQRLLFSFCFEHAGIHPMG